MATYNMNRNVYEGWTPMDFIQELLPLADMVMRGQSWQKPFKDIKELKAWLKDNQPYYKKEIPEVVDFFANRYGFRRGR